MSCQAGFQEFCSLGHRLLYSTTTIHYANCDVMNGKNKNFKLKYLINKALQRKGIKELVLQF